MENGKTFDSMKCCGSAGLYFKGFTRVQWFDSLHCGNFLSDSLSVVWQFSVCCLIHFYGCPYLTKLFDRTFAYLTHFSVNVRVFFSLSRLLLLLLFIPFILCHFNVDDVLCLFIWIALNISYCWFLSSKQLDTKHNAFYHIVNLSNISISIIEIS